MAEQNVLLEIRKLKKDYGNGPVLEDISLQVEKGEVIVDLRDKRRKEND